MKPYFHYIFRSSKIAPEKKPVVTICYLKDDMTGKIAKGIALCSRLDEFSYTIGRDIAWGRAVAAMKEQRSGRLVNGMNGVVSCTIAGIDVYHRNCAITKSTWDASVADALCDSDRNLFEKIKAMPCAAVIRCNLNTAYGPYEPNCAMPA